MRKVLNRDPQSFDGYSLVSYLFQGGQEGRLRRFCHQGLTYTRVIEDSETKEIVGVHYYPDNDYLNSWLRCHIDPSIPNNYEDLYKTKEFEVLITTYNFSQELVKVEGKTYKDCEKKTYGR